MSKVYATPGVYIEEKSAFPNSAVPVATAVPAFIGYTQKAVLSKKDITNVPTRISSFGEYLLYFGEGPKTIYTIANSADRNKVYELEAKNARFYLFQCIKLFFANGGSDCYIVSIGSYEDGIQAADFEGEKPDEDEPGVSKLIGLKALLKESEPTMVVIPDAVSLGEDDCYSLQQKMLLHCGSEMRSRVAILDIYDGFKKRTPDGDTDVVERFRTGIGANFLQWGAVYYPWVHTTITGAEEVDFTNIDGENTQILVDILSTEVNDAKKEGVLDPKRADKILEEIKNLAGLNTIAEKTIDAAKAAKKGADKDLQGAEAALKKATKEDEKQKKKDLADAKAAAKMADAVLAAAVALDEQGKLTKAQGEVDKAQKAADKAKEEAEATKTAQAPEGNAAKNKTAEELANKVPPLEEAVKAAAKIAQAATKAAKEAKAAAITADDVKTLHQTLWAISPMYKSIMSSLREKINLLPPSAGMAGIYSMVDNNVGVFQSPANVSVGSVVRPAVNLTNDEQEDLNMPLSGKAVNAIRTFPGKGVMVWGARTLDGNSQDWKYVSVRRTVIFIEQSIKYAAEPYVFSPNTAATWTNVKAMLINFLTNVWQQGALAGATPEDAFSVHIGLGETMTPVDILEGYMRITVKLAVTRPAEFIVITFEQQMQKS